MYEWNSGVFSVSIEDTRRPPCPPHHPPLPSPPLDTDLAFRDLLLPDFFLFESHFTRPIFPPFLVFRRLLQPTYASFLADLSPYITLSSSTFHSLWFSLLSTTTRQLYFFASLPAIVILHPPLSSSLPRPPLPSALPPIRSGPGTEHHLHFDLKTALLMAAVMLACPPAGSITVGDLSHSSDLRCRFQKEPRLAPASPRPAPPSETDL